jgi:hypothetical protein
MVKKSKKSKSKRVTLRQKHKVLRKVKEHHRKKRKEANKQGRAGGRKKVEKDPGIPNEWPFKEQELKALEVRRAKALQELEAKKEARKERVSAILCLSLTCFFRCCYATMFVCGDEQISPGLVCLIPCRNYSSIGWYDLITYGDAACT